MKKSLLLAVAFSTLAVASQAQKLGEGYVSWPESQKLHSYITAWNGGNGTLTVNGEIWEDMNFFISRVKPKARFYDTGTQVYPGLTQWTTNNKNGTDKRLAFWVPISNDSRDGVKLNALPDGTMDGEVFSMWMYVDNYGDWSAPFGWTPGAFADVCHKNGVSTHGVAGIPNASMSSEWRSCLQGLVSLGAEKVGKFLYYFGQDGLGYNSEWTSGESPTGMGLTTLHNDLGTYMADKDPLWEVMWYNCITDNGAIAWDSGLSNKTGIFKGASAFQNYNWNSTSYMTSAITAAENMGKSPFYIYAGMNTQGGEPKSGSNYDLLKNYKYSIGLWGAHQVNMYWQDRASNGSSDVAKASNYQNLIERWFGNGVRNPAIKKTIKLNRTHRPTDDWAGMSAMMSARSTLNWDLASEPFYSYFNLGNGQFFNWKGERMHNNGWYNIGVQDYLPTWRFWFAPTWMGGRTNTISESDVHMDAAFTWDDAYVGGSCLKISGTSSDEYLHLFKTHFTTGSGATKARVIYKVLGGSADVELVANNGYTSASALKFSILKKADCADVEDKSYVEGADGWTVAEVTLTGGRLNIVGALGLHFTNAEDFEMLLGGIELDKNGVFEKPAQPTLTTTKVLAYNTSGVDAKLIWDMNPGYKIKAKGEPCYNSDVNTSVFRLWAQQKGGEPQNMGITTSWAGLVYAAKIDASGEKQMRFGVSAVSLDTKDESDITWSDYESLPTYVTIEDITINKTIIKPNEKFELSFVDPMHATGTWTISDPETGAVLWTGSGQTVECPGLPSIGAFNLTLTSNGKTLEYPRYVSISSEAVGALPEIYSLSIDGNNAEGTEMVQIELNDSKTFSYTGRKADGSASRGVDLNERWFGVSCGELGITGRKSFSVAAWVKYNELPEGLSSFITVEDRITGGWPFNNWGFFWSRINEEGRFVINKIDTSWGMRMGGGTEGQRLFYRYDDAKIDVGAWTHVVVSFEYKTGTNQMRSAFYINGKKQMVSQWAYVNKGSYEGQVGKWGTNSQWSDLVNVASHVSGAKYGSNTYEPDFCADDYQVTNATWIAFGGTSQEISAVKGCVDDFQVWGKAMTDEEVLASMNGLDKNNLPADVLGYWDFEESTVTSGGKEGFRGYTGTSATNKSPMAYWYTIGSGGENDNQRIYGEPTFLTGCPFISGTAFPVVTKPTWTTRRASVNGDGNGEAGSADIAWTKPGDYTVELKLANGHGEATMEYPVVRVGEGVQGIEDITTDGGDFDAYTIDDALFVEFAADGAYDIEVYNTAGVLVGKKLLEATAGQNASVALGTAGVYIVKVVKDGTAVRTLKVIRK
ncbi:MAG: T9SS type A sorting domain-containing protein [Bacteroides sp.]|nr:T9SS type A sorting domain-containing protein [Bacteroides sp.]MCM1413546.1 T9SS type A sorting domain-containing protein [Bacteroides sp.]MCM1471100.1 T9SS type A sorting domain-containing protein [Bacteroides sp.]